MFGDIFGNQRGTDFLGFEGRDLLVQGADLDALLKDKAKLTAVLTYHVVAGKVMAADVKAGKVKTVQGSDLTVTTTGGVQVNGAHVVKTDIVADNGVIHVIDTVLMPK